MNTSRYIEIIGTPGSGKTVMGKLLLSALEEQGFPATLRSPLRADFLLRVKIVLRTIVFLFMHPVLLRLWFLSVSTEYSDTPHVRSVIRNIRVRAVVEAVVARDLTNGESRVVINDEGIVGKLVVLSLITNMQRGLCERMLRHLLPNCSLLIALETPTDVALERASQRGIVLPFFDEMNENLKKSFYEESEVHYMSVAGVLQEEKFVELLRVKHTASGEELAAEVKRIVSSRF